MSELQIQRCERCGTSAFPDRLWCPGCGAGGLQHVPAGPGRVEEETVLRRPPPVTLRRPPATTLRRPPLTTLRPPPPTAPTPEPVRLGTVRLASGPVVIARLATGTAAGTQVWLERAATRTIWARPTPD